jgi:hypothetical protein
VICRARVAPAKLTRPIFVERAEITVPRFARLVLLAATCVCAGVAACSSSPSPARTSSSQSATPSTSSLTLSDVQFKAARTFSRLKANSVTVKGGSPFSTWHEDAVARSEACHAFLTAIGHESWPANVSAVIMQYINLETELCRHEDKFVAARTFDEFIAIPPPVRP